MSDSEVRDQEIHQEARRWIDQLLIGTGKDRKKAALELGRLGVRTRGSILPRGTLYVTPRDRFPDPEKIEALLEHLNDEDKEVRSQVALALGEWGGEETAAALRRVLESDSDEQVQLYCITALRTIGGRTSSEGLRYAVASGTEAVRDAAISAIEDLATGGRVDCTEGPDLTQQSKSSSLRIIGDVRTRGAAQRRRGTQTDLVNDISDTLQKIRDEEGSSDYLRLRAEEVLKYFRE